jgi:ABC-2 type transport system ATP-binding protein
MVSVEGVCHIYPPSRRGGAPRQALCNVSFTVQPGEIFGLLGPNGSGKTTLFKILSTLLKPSSGRVHIAGADAASRSHDVRERLGVTFQAPSLDKKLTVAENLLHHGHLYGLHGVELRKRISRTLQRGGIEDRARDLVETLSGGLARRVELAQTMLHEPEVLILDEPSTGLDPGARRDLWQHLETLREEARVTVLLTTHLMDEAANCDRLALLHHGNIVALGSPEQLTSEIGADIITIHVKEPEQLLPQLQRKFGDGVSLLNGAIRIERTAGHEFIPLLVEAFPGRIREISLGKPTLEDVFIHRTGQRID